MIFCHITEVSMWQPLTARRIKAMLAQCSRCSLPILVSPVLELLAFGSQTPEPEHHKPGRRVPGFFLLRSLRLYITYAKERLVVKLCL